MSGASGMQTLRQGWWHPPRRKTIDCNCFLVAVILVTALLGHTSAQTSNMSCSTTQCYQNFSIPEDFPVGREVGRIDISHTYTDIATDKKQLADSTAVFNVNLATGVITTKAPLDRETTPTGYAFVLIPEKDGLPVYVQIFLLDVNDNSPKFNPPNITLNFSESAPNVTKKALGSVTDPDLGMNSTATVMILSGNTGDAFSLQQKSLGAFDILLDLKVNSRLDYELVPSYSLVIIATDGGGKSGMMYVTINILDQNDNQPIFNASKYEVQLAENVTVGTKVIQVQATDQDSGDNGKIRYSIDSKSDPEAHFRIDPITGEVTVNKPLDYETQPMFRLILEATDSGPSPLTGNAALDIKLLNINEQPADIRLTFLQGGDRQGHVLENIQKGTPVARISIDDPDITIGLHMLVNVSLLGGDDVFGLQITDDVLSLVVVNSPPDREQKAVYHLTVIVTDSGNPPLRASESFTVYIDDVNDNAPKFTKNPFEGEVPETAEIGTYVLRVNATDPDLGDNSRIVYSILGNSNPQVAWFQIDSNTGVITTQASINCEQNPQPTFIVTARDNGDPPLSGSTNVIITVRDVNNQQPVFDPSFYTVEVSEDADIGFCPLTVYGKDPECGARSPVTYEMVMNESTPTEFNVSRDTGNICIGKSLDYERNKNYEFLVLVIDRDGLSASAAVRVTVTDVNDNKPFFEPKDYSLNIENKKLPGPLIAVQGADLDSPPKFGTVTYSFTTNPAPELFSIDSGSGIISLVKPFPNETRLYTLFVQGTDGGGLVSDSPAKVNISIYSEVAHLPAFTLTMYNFTVSEDAPLSTLVGRVEATISGVSSGRAVVGYSIVYKSRNWFRIDNASGEIFTAAPLDRENNPFVLLVVQAQSLTSPTLFASAQVNFTLLDINDNSPFFPASNILHIKVREDTQPPNPIYIAHAEDKDAGSNGFIKYRINNDPDGRFDIDEVSGEIYLKTILDYEECRAYQLLIIAEDQGVSGHRSTNMTLVVSVTDVNDNKPNFSQPLYDFYIREDAPIGFTFGRVNATDRDSDQNGRVSYSFQTTPYMSLFGIFTVDGVITTRDALDREMQDLYSLTVMAIDHGTPSPLSASAVVRIHITDVNDNDPIFSSPEYKFTIQENLPLGTYVGQVYATDRDNGDNARLQFQFIKTNQSKFVINTYNGEVTTLVALDREEQEDYFLEVYVADSGATQQRSSTATIRVKVLDDNDNRPTFTIPDLNRSVSENRPKGTQVMKVVAQDPDAGENGTVSFYLDPIANDDDVLSNFNIHPATGWIVTQEVLDYETKRRYSLGVVAHDNGTPRLTQMQTIYIDVLDDNDEAPLFHAMNVNFDVVENVSIGTMVGRVTAEDKDSGENGRVFYYLVGGNVFSLFAVDPSSGVIQTIRKIDYEESSSHVLSIQAVDNNVAFPQSSNISVTIHVMDINDNAPEFDNDPVFLRTVRENTPIDHIVHTFIATDLDSGRNGSVHYSIANESASGVNPGSGNYFKIDPVSGELKVAKSIDYERVQTITVIVQAQDKCPLPACILSTQATTVVFVLDVNDNRPVFESQTEVHIFEDEPVGYPVLFIVAVDSDSNQDDSGNNLVNYGIISGNEDGKFALDRSSGLLTIAEPLDRETKALYLLNVSAEDSGTPKTTATQLLRVFIEDVNDNTPVFELSSYHGIVIEDQPAGASVTKVQASDSDTGMNGNLTYIIPRGLADDKFTVDARSGQISTTQKLDREEKSSYILTVYVKDGGYPTLYDWAIVYVQVQDINDHSPVFERKSYLLQIPENHVQSSIVSLLAIDQDEDDNGKISYSITGGAGKFSIESSTGKLSCQSLDRESQAVYNLIVTGSDSGTPRRSGSAEVVVTVLDENDNSPRFSESIYTATLAEDVAKGQTVMRVLASDPDQGKNGEVAYSLGNDTEGFFSVNSTSGDIMTSGLLDREKNSSFVFYLLASDGGGSGPRNATIRIEITVSDVNDNAPVFRQVPYKTTVSQSYGANQTILQVTADDADFGVNGSVVYRLLNGSNNPSSLQYFDINQTTGRIFTRTSLTSALGYYNLLVIASDKGSPPLSSTGVVEIVVGNNTAPQLTFEKAVYQASIPENSNANTSITTVRASFTTGSTPSGQGSITYSFANGNQRNTFKINSSTGSIQVADPTLLDYETTPQHQLIVAASASGTYAYASLHVNLTDLNDNAPKFAQTKYVSAIWENNKPETYITQVIARDADSLTLGMIEYSIIGGDKDQVFVIKLPHTGIITTNIDKSSLDREIQSSYTLVIQAQDLGFPPLSSTCTLEIAVVDQNDNPPKFPSPGPGPINVSEYEQAGFLVAIVTATDVDLNPVLVYDFALLGNPDRAFSIDKSSGTVLLARSLDYEGRKHYSIKLLVSDGVFSDSTTLEVYVDDENDNAPKFVEQSYQFVVAEQTPPMQSVFSVSATDADENDNAIIRYSLGLSSSPNFVIDPENGKIYTNKTITSSLTESVLQLVVIAQDKGSPPLSSMVAVQVQVTEVNKFKPVFLKANYTASVNESLQKGTEILQVVATDEDYNRRSDNVHYQLSSGATTFYIQSDTGRILLNGPIDREQTTRYDFYAIAIDRGMPPRNSSVPIIIYITDVNDNPPVFIQPYYSIELPENYPKEHIFLTVEARDADFGPNAELEFSITSGNSDGVFYNHKSGGLIVMSKMDYETRTSHRLIMRAVDCVGCAATVPRLSAFVTVDINVTDINEFSPQFPVRHYYESVMENVKPFMTVFQVHANDQDGGEFGRIVYNIDQENDATLFRINSITGDVITQQTFDYERDVRHTYNITIRATDQGSRFDTVGVTISIADEDEYAPAFSQTSYKFEVPGSAKEGHYIATVRASDADTGTAGRLVYNFDTISDYFQIDPFSGNVTVLRTLHDDVPGVTGDSRKRRALRTDSETLIIRVSSGQVTSLSATTFCIISIDRTCPGCQAPVAQADQDPALSNVAIAFIVIVCILVPSIIIVLFLVFHIRRRNKKHPPDPVDNAGFGGRTDTSNFSPPPHENTPVLPSYKESTRFGQHNMVNIIPSSGISEQSNNSASSGRGSVEVEDEDEEIRMINDVNAYHTNSAGYRQKTMPDSGIQQDDDTLSEPSATTHQEYLARLGIDSTKIGKSGSKSGGSKSSNAGGSSVCGGGGGGDGIAFSVESMHQFSDEGGGEGGVDFDCDKLTDTEVDEEVAMIDRTSRQAAGANGGLSSLAFQEPASMHAGVLSNVVNSEEEYSGSYNWDYLLDWGPQYQPLAHVFTEIAKLKDESITPKKQPVKTVPQRNFAASSGLAMPNARIVPPPIITSAPPLVAGDKGGESAKSNTSSKGNGSVASAGTSHVSATSFTSSSGTRSQRTSAINSSLPSLPRSPISYESSYTSPALSPSYTPSLSPLGGHTPSISPAVSGHTGVHTNNSGHNTPGKPVSKPPRQHFNHHNNNNSQHNINYHGHGQPSKANGRITLSASSESEREFRI